MSLARIYGPALGALFTGAINLADLQVMAVADTYAPDQDADEFRADVTGEITGTGYTAGGQAAPATATYDATQNELTVTLDADPSWATLTASGIRYLVFYVDTGSSATDPLLCWIDFEENVDPPAAATWTVPQPASGLITVRILT